MGKCKDCMWALYLEDGVVFCPRIGATGKRITVSIRRCDAYESKEEQS